MVRGERIRALREERGYTLQDLAIKASLSLSYLSELERGSKCPSLRTVDKLAAALNVPKDQLVEGELKDATLTLGDKIRLLRRGKKLSLQEMASCTEISPSYLSEIERGTVYPSLDTLKRLAKVLDVPVTILMNHRGSLGYKLKLLREEYGLTQAQLSGLVGVTAGLIGQIEQGKVQPSLKTLEKIAEVMGVTPCYFIVDDGTIDQLLSSMNPELRELLVHPNVQVVLNMICNLNKKELQFVLNFIQLLKKSELS